MNIVKNIEILCRSRYITVSALERDLNFSKGSIRKWNLNFPSIDKVSKVANYFFISIDELLNTSIQDNLEAPDKLNILNKLLKEKGISKAKFLKDLGYKKNIFIDWEMGRTDSYMNKIDKIADYFNVSVDYLLGRDEISAPPQIIRAAQPSKGKDYEDLEADLKRLEDEIRKIKEKHKK